MDTTQRIERLEACEAIRRLISLYAMLLDTHRFDDWGRLFSEDGVFRVWDRRYEGRSEIQREICGMQRPGVPGKHVLLQPVIDLAGPDRARAWTDMSAMTTTDAGIVSATIGCYHDELVRIDGRWHFASRTLVMAGEAVPDDVAPAPAR
jgi:3-phenylpropionate/cinnamic acid dioxygenase small subunit